MGNGSVFIDNESNMSLQISGEVAGYPHAAQYGPLVKVVRLVPFTARGPTVAQQRGLNPALMRLGSSTACLVY